MQASSSKHRSIKLYNTRTQSLETFNPNVEGQVKMYLCGLTTYDHAHAGHARTNVCMDVLVRHLKVRGYEVTFVRNVTDVDDKILKRADELGLDPLHFSANMSEICAKELGSVGCMRPTHEPRVSEHLPEIIELIETLIKKNAAYVVDTPQGKDVYFRVQSCSEYGKLSKRKPDDLKTGARVSPNELKQNPLDFALWKGAHESTWGFVSPWGRGRPGWHIECSALAKRYLGPHLDIHAGGMDLIFPHHENEIAQSETAWSPEFSTFWVHVGFLEVDGEKMSKSLGNFVTIQQVLEKNDAEGFRFFLLSAHYRGPLHFDVAEEDMPLLDKHETRKKRVYFPSVDECERRLEYMYSALKSLAPYERGGAASSFEKIKKEKKSAFSLFSGLRESIFEALDQDLNTSIAIRLLGEAAKAGHEWAAYVSKSKKDSDMYKEACAFAAFARDELKLAARPLGLLQEDPDIFFSRTQKRRLGIFELSPNWIEEKIAERDLARKAGDFLRADQVRDELKAQKIELYDSKGHTEWKVTQ